MAIDLCLYYIFSSGCSSLTGTPAPRHTVAQYCHPVVASGVYPQDSRFLSFCFSLVRSLSHTLSIPLFLPLSLSEQALVLWSPPNTTLKSVCLPMMRVVLWRTNSLWAQAHKFISPSMALHGSTKLSQESSPITGGLLN